MKRNICSTIFEIFFPILLILICLALKQVFKIKTVLFDDEEGNEDDYIKSKSAFYGTSYKLYDIADESNTGLSILPVLKICSERNKNKEKRVFIADIGSPGVRDIKSKIEQCKGDPSGDHIDIDFKYFSNVDEFNKYIKDNRYGNDDDYPLICFGIRIDYDNNHNWDYSLHYFDTVIQDIPTLRGGLFNQFQSGPDLDSYKIYQENGFLYIIKIINEYILQKEISGNPDFQIDVGMIPMKYIDYRSDPFSAFIGYIIPFFIVIAYMCPLCLYVYRMVGEKENKSKEGMKIMGLGEGTYFLSYFIQYVIIALIDSIINGIIMSILFKKIPFIFLFLLLFLWTLDVFALIFFFQSFIDKTRVALILSLLIYFVMYFLSMACMSETANKAIKIILSLFPPVCIELGIILFGKFEANFRQFHASDYVETYTNYCIGVMNLMQVIDFLLFLFLGYYLQNVLPHEFGIRKPFYFICTKNYWCGSKKNENGKNLNQNIEILEDEEGRSSQKKMLKPVEKQKKNDSNFESEDLYKDKTKPDDALRIENIVKIFGDGKKAVDNVSLNFYKDEIFALLGHNGAGKTTLISMLTGLYEATEGSAYFDNYNILESNNMEEFRTILGICPQHDVLFDDLNIREHLEMFCIFKGFSSGNIDAEVDKTIHDFELENIQNITSKNLSAGQRRKLSIAISLIGGSKVIFLDEPSSGMDITSRRNLWDILKRQSEQKIIILTTHYMEEASVLGKRIGIINAGKMKCIGTPLFLIERFGRFMSLNITKEEGADNRKIINFIGERAKDIDYEILSEEILFRIPKSNYSSGGNTDEENLTLTENSSSGKKSNANNSNNSNLNITKFFDDLDKNLKELGIKTYSASMPTLEDVFLNVAQDDVKEENQKMGKQHRKFSIPNEENDKILFEIDFKEDYSKKSKFCNDFRACFHRRFLLTSRDLKGFLMEILCPILLVLVGLLVSKVDMIKESEPQIMDMGSIGKQTILYGAKSGVTLQNDYQFNGKNITSKTLSITGPNDKDFIKDFFLQIFDNIKDIEDCEKHEVDMMDEDYTGIYGSFLLLADDTNYVKFIEILNARIRHVVPIYTYNFLTAIVKKHAPNANINFKLYPMPFTAEQENQKDQMGNSLIVFFVAIAFSLIPANFITIIVKEKLNNSKHLMRVSGISILAYWIVNFIYELVKYFFTCGICIGFLAIFDFYRDYLYIIYILYGPAMIFVTYALSFLFDSESGAQNGIILLNFLLGALGSSVILMLRSVKSVKSVAKIIQYILCLLPSFSFNFGYTLLLNKMMILQLDYPTTFYKMEDSVVIEKFDLLLCCIVFLSAEILVYSLILVFIEAFAYFSLSVQDNKLTTEINDSKVLKEVERANQESNKIGITDENGNSDKPEFSVRVKNLKKVYSTGLCSKPMTAIKNMSFCVEPGECFGLLGLNGAGKTTTFKCITQEIAPTHGKIYINGRDMRNSFGELSSIFGYCPQFDAIFEYMSVYENLEFYGKIKGIKPEYLDKVVRSMIEEMSLGEFVEKIAGRLSGGNKRKLSVAISFLCSPPIVLLDEPSTGMDPEARRFMWSVIHKISTKGKKASVIMTTHSMDEAETLCKRMAIMVNGEFVCLGKAGEIKEKYGYGYEVEVRIKPLSEKQFEKITQEHNLDKNMKIDFSNIEEILNELKEGNFIKELQKGRFGSRLIRDIEMNRSVPLRSLISWTFFVKNALNFIRNAQPYFENIILTEYIDNNFLFKMKKNSNTKTTGFFFGLFENNKDKNFVTEYSIQQTSLEQIFNMFEAQQRRSNQIEEEKKEEILIDDEIYNSLIK